MQDDHKKLPLSSGLNSRTLAKAIFDADVPEELIRTIPAQSLYLTIKYNGLASSADLLEIATLQQCRLLLDFDCWDHKSFNEENFWEWLAVTDATNSLIILEKLLRFVDLKLIAMLIAKYVRCEIQEEPSDQPHEPGFYTPDKGYTWLSIEIEDGTKQFLLGRLLALIFESDAELFYQLIAIPNVSTYSMLEEKSFQDRERRLSEEGIPDEELAYELNSPLSIAEATTQLQSKSVFEICPARHTVQPLIYDHLLLKPLGNLFRESSIISDLESELTMLMNAAIVHWNTDFDKLDALQLLTQQVKGAINIGLEALQKINDNSLIEIYKTLGLAKIYRHGLTHLFNLRKLALKLKQQFDSSTAADPIRQAQLEAACSPFPYIIITSRKEQSPLDATSGTSSEKKAIETLDELNSLVEDLVTTQKAPSEKH